MKKVLLTIVLVAFMLSGCVYQADLRPEYNDSDVWVCESPYMELYWSESQGHVGRISYDGNQYDIIHEEDYGAAIWIYTAEAMPFYNTDVPEEFWVLKGHMDYGKNNLSIKVEKDFKNIFNGELPTMEFTRYSKEEYFRNN